MRLAAAMAGQLSSVLLGADHSVMGAVLAVLSGTHLLIEDVPGVGKTLLAKALAASVGGSFARVQGHPDLLPSDITGVSIYNPEGRSWELVKGPVFANVVLVDELNRTPPRTQAALLEAMAEHQVTIDGSAHRLPAPNIVVATQNPLSELGTFPLVESQLDRFGISTTIGYPQIEIEVDLATDHGGERQLATVEAKMDVREWAEAQEAVKSVRVAGGVARYAVTICRETRSQVGVMLGASPRAVITLVRVAQANAVMAGRDYVVPDDVKSVAQAVLKHRIMTEGITGRDVVRNALVAASAPRP